MYLLTINQEIRSLHSDIINMSHKISLYFISSTMTLSSDFSLHYAVINCLSQ